MHEELVKRRLNIAGECYGFLAEPAQNANQTVREIRSLYQSNTTRILPGFLG